jgi:hypothetical protein
MRNKLLTASVLLLAALASAAPASARCGGPDRHDTTRGAVEGDRNLTPPQRRARRDLRAFLHVGVRPARATVRDA